MWSRKLVGLVVAVDLAAVAAIASLPVLHFAGAWTTLVLLAALSALAGAWPVHFASRRVELTATHPVVFSALVLLGPVPAVLTAVAGAAATMLVHHRSRRLVLQLPFNLGAVTIATVAASWTFLGLGGEPGSRLAESMWPLAGATAIYFVTNTGLVSLVASLRNGRSVLTVWRESFSWTVASYLSGFTLAALMLVVLEALGPWGLVLALPPCWLLVSFYRTHRERLNEQQLRIEDVERLNAELSRTVGELRDVAAHVKRLQGLIPICMHCKSIRDDKQIWHRIESYLAEHSDAVFTHSLCEPCRTKHYGSPGSRTA